MKKISLKKQAALAPKYVLKLDGLNLFVSNTQSLIGCNLTKDLNEAMKYSIGFDDENTKIDIWLSSLKRSINADIKLNVVYL